MHVLAMLLANIGDSNQSLTFMGEGCKLFSTG
jgi:hypothetical protein